MKIILPPLGFMLFTCAWSFIYGGSRRRCDDDKLALWVSTELICVILWRFKGDAGCLRRGCWCGLRRWWLRGDRICVAFSS